jgi:hypothetical protein
MRIHDLDNDRAIANASLYLTNMEAAKMIGYLLDMVKKCRIRDFRIDDAKLEHELRVFLYNEIEPAALDERPGRLVAEDI